MAQKVLVFVNFLGRGREAADHRSLEVILALQVFVTGKNRRHYHEMHPPPHVWQFHSVHPVKPGDEGTRRVKHVDEIARENAAQKFGFLLRHGLDDVL